MFIAGWALLGMLSTLDSGFPSWWGLTVGGLIGGFFGLVFGGVRGRWLDYVLGPEGKSRPDEDRR